MKIYSIRRTDDYGYDEYDSCVVIAKDRFEAIEEACESCWFNENSVECEYLGETNDNRLKETVCSSFNAG